VANLWITLRGLVAVAAVTVSIIAAPAGAQVASVTEVVTLKIKPDATVDAFRAADRDVERQHVARQPGFVSRESAPGADHSWVVIVHWRSTHDAQASMESFEKAPAAARFMSLVVPDTMQINRYGSDIALGTPSMTAPTNPHPSSAEAAVREGVDTYIRSIDAADTELAGRVFQTTPDTFFIHPRGTERGWDAVVTNFYGKTMRDSFSKRSLQLAEPVRVHVHGSSAVAEFSWKFDAVFRQDGKPLHTEGRESQTWADLPGLGWRIVAVHYSGLPVTDAGQGF
jgi:hypothetical protein